MMKRAVFLDRDGVLNRAVLRGGKPYPPASIGELEILPDVPMALRQLREAGFLLIVVTNQPDVARGKQSRTSVEAINARLSARLPLDAIEVCYEDDNNCPRRKPNPGMILDAASALNVDLAESFLVGDRWKDIEAGQRAGCRTVHIDWGYAEPRPDPPADRTTKCLAEGASWILAQGSGKEKSNAISE